MMIKGIKSRGDKAHKKAKTITLQCQTKELKSRRKNIHDKGRKKQAKNNAKTKKQKPGEKHMKEL